MNESLIIRLLLFIPCYWISAIIHELGHVIVGWAHGWKLFVFVVSPIGIKRKDDKITNRLTLYFEKNPVNWAGIAGIYPVREDKFTTKAWSRVLLGGSIASIISGIIFSLIFFIHFHYIWLLLSVMTVLMGIVCLIPAKTSGTYTDGKRWRRLRNGGQESEEEIALFKMLFYELFEKDKSLMRKDEFEALLQAEHPTFRYYGYYYLYLFSDFNNDSENKEKALDVLQSMKNSVSKAVINDCGV